MEILMETGMLILPLSITLALSLVILAGAHKLLLSDPSLDDAAKLPRKLIMIFLYIASLIALALALPVAESTRNQIIGLIGILLSGVIAFSSTSIVANIMAGIVMRFTKPFRTGDFIRVEQYFGRVTERGLFDTEIQTEQRELIAFTNSYLTSHPLTVIRSSGTIVSANLSLGYDVYHGKIETLLLEAAKNSELEDPFVQVIELGNYAVSYRVSGLLVEVKSLISARSRLLCNVLDTLHASDIEIMSPNFMNTRQINELAAAIPHPSEKTAVAKSPHNAPELGEAAPEQMIFDKADEAEKKELSIIELREKLEQLNASLKEAEAEAKDAIKASIELTQTKIKALSAKEEP